MVQAMNSGGARAKRESRNATVRSTEQAGEESLRGREWDIEALGPIDERDAENIDLDVQCINEAMERKYGR